MPQQKKGAACGRHPHTPSPTADVPSSTRRLEMGWSSTANICGSLSQEASNSHPGTAVALGRPLVISRDIFGCRNGDRGDLPACSG